MTISFTINSHCDMMSSEMRFVNTIYFENFFKRMLLYRPGFSFTVNIFHYNCLLMFIVFRRLEKNFFSFSICLFLDMPQPNICVVSNKKRMDHVYKILFRPYVYCIEGKACYESFAS
jgi:hypothetical protein